MKTYTDLYKQLISGENLEVEYFKIARNSVSSKITTISYDLVIFETFTLSGYQLSWLYFIAMLPFR